MSREGALWIGGLEPYMDEEFLMASLRLMGEENVLSIKVIKNKFTGEPASYGFINFDSDPAALMAMHKLNGKIMPNSQPPARWKLNHNSNRLLPGEKDHSIWVGDLSLDVDDLQFYRFFSARFQSVKSAKVVQDNVTGESKGYGFIKFGDEQEQKTALLSMMGILGCGTKPIRVSIAVPKAQMAAQAAAAAASNPAAAIASGNTASITDTLSANTLAAVVARASGNPNAGAAVVAEAQNAEYQKYWSQYYAQQQQQQQQQQWEQYAAWNDYNQQGYYGQEAGAAGQEGHGDWYEVDPAYEEAMQELVEHTPEFDLEAYEREFFGLAEEFWDTMEDSRWPCLDLKSEEMAEEDSLHKIELPKEKAKVVKDNAKSEA